MQVFVPYADFKQSVQALDNSRLLKQVLEATQLLDIMFDVPTKSGKPRTGWLNHPALIAWKNTPGALIEYTIHAIIESKNRGFKTDTYEEKIKSYRRFTTNLNMPVWWDDDLVHSSHRARLLQKGWESLLKADANPTKVMSALKIVEWYKSFNWVEMCDEQLMCREYKWPHNISRNSYELQVSVSKDALKNKEKLIETYGMNPFLKDFPLLTENNV